MTKVMFPVCGNDTELAARTRFYNELKDLQEQVNINEEKGEYLYFILFDVWRTRAYLIGNR